MVHYLQGLGRTVVRTKRYCNGLGQAAELNYVPMRDVQLKAD